jgi:hypothetical protein
MKGFSQDPEYTRSRRFPWQLPGGSSTLSLRLASDNALLIVKSCIEPRFMESQSSVERMAVPGRKRSRFERAQRTARGALRIAEWHRAKSAQIRRQELASVGGGSLPKFCYRHLPRSRITVVEIDKDVIALRDEFCVPKDDERFRVVYDDGARFIERLDETMDVLLVDAFDADGIALSLAKSDFYFSAARQLTESGVLVMNFWGPPERYVDNLTQVRAAFGDTLLLVPVSGEANVLLFAFKQAAPRSITDELETIAQRLQMRLLLDYPRYLRRICQGFSLADPQTSIEQQISRTFCLQETPSASANAVSPSPEIDEH